MSERGQGRRATAEVRWSKDPGAIVWVGERPLHHYWPLLSPYFRDVFLPPHRRAEEDAVAWNWSETSRASPPTPGELATLRKRLAADQQTFAESVTRRGGAGDAAAGARSHADLDQLGAVMASVTARLNARSNAELALFVCRSDAGLRLHSWGATAPAQPTYPDEQQREVSGVVIVAARPSPGHDVVLADDAGAEIAHVRSDAKGCFRFSNLAAATYRLRVVSERARFPADGVTVNAERGSATGIELRSADDRSAPVAARAARGRFRALWIGAGFAAVAAIVGAGAIWIARSTTSELPSPETKVETARVAPAAARAESARTAASAAAPSAAIRREMAAAAKTSVAAVTRAPLGRETTAAPLEQSELSREIVAPLDTAPPASPAGQGAAAAVAANGPSGATSAAAAGAASSKGGAAAAGAHAASAVASAAPDVVEPPEKTSPPKQRAEPAKTRSAAALPIEAASETKREMTTAARPDPARAPRSEARPETPPVADALETKPVVADSAAEAQPARTTSPAAATDDEDALTERTARSRPTPNRSRPTPTADPLPSVDEAVTARVASARPIASAWHTIVRLRIPAWRMRLTGDAILPTQPLPAGTTDPVASMQAELLRAKTAQMPSSLREPVVMFGCTFAMRAEAEWQQLGGARPLVAVARASAAEVGWSAAPAHAGARSVLRRRDDGRAIAEFFREADGTVVVRVADDVVARPWVAVAVASADDARRFAWRPAAEEKIAPVAADLASVPQFLRCPLPVKVSTVRALALCDGDTQWALTAEVGITVETAGL